MGGDSLSNRDQDSLPFRELMTKTSPPCTTSAVGLETSQDSTCISTESNATTQSASLSATQTKTSPLVGVDCPPRQIVQAMTPMTSVEAPRVQALDPISSQ